ncbi:hypothetical protein CFP66_06805 [Pseudonocardia sp. MH-G8]|nr:hypothetical protein CFP66_06805 [Pseudonocardia sp. MH-G8]
MESRCELDGVDPFATSPPPTYLDCCRGHRFTATGSTGRPVECEHGGHVEFACRCGAVLAVVPVREETSTTSLDGTVIPGHWFWRPCDHAVR